MLSVQCKLFMLSVIILNVVRLSVVAPKFQPFVSTTVVLLLLLLPLLLLLLLLLQYLVL